MGKRILVMTAALLLLGSLVATTPASAKSVKTPVEYYEVICVNDPGLVWTSGKGGKIVHTRGAMSLSWMYETENFAVIGENVLVTSSNLDTTTGKGEMWGTFSSYFPLLEGGFTGTWNGKFEPLPVFLGRAVGKGKGSYAGQKVKVTLESVAPADVPVEILRNLPCNPASPTFAGIFRDSGFIHNPHGG